MSGGNNAVTKGCPECGAYSLLPAFKFCPWCVVPLEENAKSFFDRINAEHAASIYGSAAGAESVK